MLVVVPTKLVNVHLHQLPLTSFCIHHCVYFLGYPDKQSQSWKPALKKVKADGT